MSRSTLRRAASALIVVVALGFVGATIGRNWAEVRTYEWDVDPFQLPSSALLLVAVIAWSVLVWSRVVARFRGGRTSYPALLRIWFLSSLAKYIPGKVWQFVAAAGMARDARLSPPVLLTSIAVYMGFAVLTAAVIAAATLPPGAMGVDAPVWMLLAAALALALLLVHPAVVNRALRLVPRALGGDVLEWHASWGDAVRIVALSLAFWVFYALPFYFFLDALTEIPMRSLPLLAGINAFSFLAGYVVFLVPAGLGVREAAITVLLAPLVGGPGAAAVLAVASRLWIVVSELLAAGAVVVFGIGRPDPGPHGPGAAPSPGFGDEA